MGHCIRTGMCCQRIPLPVSPRGLREAYEQSLRRENERRLVMYDAPQSGAADDVIYQDIHLIYPMLLGRCLGKMKRGVLWDLINAKRQAQMKEAVLAQIKDDALAQMPADLDGDIPTDLDKLEHHPGWTYIYGPCKFFGWEEAEGSSKLLGNCTINSIKPQMCVSYPSGFPGTFRGCGYNAHQPEIGVTREAFQQMVPLDESEK